MSWIKQLFDSIRGDINNAGQSLADARAIPALEQKVRDAKEELNQAKSALTEVMAQEKLTGKRVIDLEKSLEEYEGYAAQADAKGDENLLNELLDKIAEVDEDLAAQRELHNGYVENVKQLKQTIVNSERSMKGFEREVKNIKATEAAQKAASMSAERFSGANSSMRTAADRMERIKERQAERSARMEAAQELADSTTGADLKQKMKAAGILKDGASRDEIRARIRARNATKA
ncbi:MAG: PspA/IM30 family protein [Gammaproteobacteria bacterium]|nr:PspA/IM30 family protein [Gammaproteobacteria bacterium]